MCILEIYGLYMPIGSTDHKSFIYAQHGMSDPPSAKFFFAYKTFKNAHIFGGFRILM